MAMDNWKLIRREPPPEGVPVMTKIDDDKGVRNEQILCFHSNLWWTGDDGNAMYVYYTPTHWKEVDHG